MKERAGLADEFALLAMFGAFCVGLPLGTTDINFTENVIGKGRRLTLSFPNRSGLVIDLDYRYGLDPWHWYSAEVKLPCDESGTHPIWAIIARHIEDSNITENWQIMTFNFDGPAGDEFGCPVGPRQTPIIRDKLAQVPRQ